jgi:CheY-like chemotaxis protein
MNMNEKFIILLVEDNPADVRLTQEALINGKVIHDMHVVSDGVEALAFLLQDEPFTQAPRPDLILLDLNMPRKNGHETLSVIKADPDLASIPVIILTTSSDDEDIKMSYDLHANGYIVKPVDIEQFFSTIQQLKEFWMSIVMLPTRVSK